MIKKKAIKKVIDLMSKFDITTQDIVNYCQNELEKQTMEIKIKVQELKSKGVIIK